MEKTVTTVLGHVAPEELGITDAHNHLWISKQELEIDGLPVLDQEDRIVEELQEYKQSGGGSQVDCQPGGAGRDGNELVRISEASGVHVIACTGYHLKEYYPIQNKIWSMNLDQAARYFLQEVNQGLEETRNSKPVYPGFIKIAAQETLKKSPKQLIEAAVIASNKTGLLIEMHTEKGSSIEDHVKFIAGLNLAPDRLVLCHIDKRPDPGLHKELCQAGFLLEYDTFFRPKYKPEVNLWPLLQEMVEGGYADSIALATDQADSGMWKFTGEGPGLAGFPAIVKDRLEEEFQDQKIVEKLMGGNIAHRLIKTEGEY